MAIQLRIILVIVSIITCIYISRKLKKSQLLVKDALFWILLSFVLILISIVPQIAMFFANLLGIQSPVNFVFLIMIFLLFMRCFLLSIRVSRLEDKLTNLVEEIAIRENKYDKK